MIQEDRQTQAVTKQYQKQLKNEQYKPTKNPGCTKCCVQLGIMSWRHIHYASMNIDADQDICLWNILCHYSYQIAV